MFAAMFQIELHGKPTYFVQAYREKDPPVRAFDSLRQGLDYFEESYHRAHSRGTGFSAGAMIHWMQLKPRIFQFQSLQDLQQLLGEVVKATDLDGSAVHESAFRCSDQEAAAKVYQTATEPHLVPASN